MVTGDTSLSSHNVATKTKVHFIFHVEIIEKSVTSYIKLVAYIAEG